MFDGKTSKDRFTWPTSKSLIRVTQLDRPLPTENRNFDYRF